MDPTSHSRKRRQEAARYGKPPVRIPSSRRVQRGMEKSGSSVPAKSDNNGATSSRSRVVQTSVATEPATVEEPMSPEPMSPKRFAVTNVGRGGALYLQPSRSTLASGPRSPTSPPGTADGISSPARADFQRLQTKEMIEGRHPRPTQINRSPRDDPLPAPPRSLHNGFRQMRPRSHSFSTMGEAARGPAIEAREFQLLVNGRSTSQRPKSSVDMPYNFLDLNIPHYRIGTPRFSDRGTAYLHNSLYASATPSEDMRSSWLSRMEFDKLFPAPPGQGLRSAPNSGHPSYAAQYLRPSRTTSHGRPPTLPSKDRATKIYPEMYDRVEALAHDLSMVRYSPKTGQILAATPARLIAQITSPLFLDYELLSDFFLTYRVFMSRWDLLEYLFCRMKWALNNDTDAGRIVRVRTFVAMRHWILNYFQDDFVPDYEFRQAFCTRVNDLLKGLAPSQSRNSTDTSILGELKKCWRRTCSTVWPSSDSLDRGPEADILPGGDDVLPELPATAPRAPISASRLDFRRSSLIQLPLQPDQNSINATPALKHLRTTSIPASPMSEDSIEVLSCSVPFLNNLRAKAMRGVRDKRSRPVGPQKMPPVSIKNRPGVHKRSGSFSDALRDERPFLPAAQPEMSEAHSVASLTFTGGLVRGLLLQPSPSSVEILLPLSPPAEKNEKRLGSPEPMPAQDRQHNVKRMVGDVYRVLSGKKDGHPSSPRSSHSSDSRASGQFEQATQQPAVEQAQAQPVPRVDMLGEKVEGSYKEVFDASAPSAEPQLTMSGALPHRDEPDAADNTLSLPEPVANRLNSHLTTGSRSIVIVDDTRPPGARQPRGVIPSVTSQPDDRQESEYASIPGFLGDQAVWEEGEVDIALATESHVDDAAISSASHSSHEQIPYSSSWSNEADTVALAVPHDRYAARKSSDVNPTGLDMPQIRHQIRRRPGGDLKAADHVHDLEPEPRSAIHDSISTYAQSQNDSPGRQSVSSPIALDARVLSGRTATESNIPGTGKSSWSLLKTHSSQPNMTPSFQAQVSHLAGLPDPEILSDGGIEDALAKLEGKASSSTTSPIVDTAPRLDSALSTASSQLNRPPHLRLVNAPLSQTGSTPSDAFSRSPLTDVQGASIFRVSATDTSARSPGMPSEIAPSIPRSSFPPQMIPSSTFRPPSSSTRPVRYSMDFASAGERLGIHDAEAVAVISGQRPQKIDMSQDSSFLLDDNESLSDISTEIADQSEDEGLGIRSFFFDDNIDPERGTRRHLGRPPSPPSSRHLSAGDHCSTQSATKPPTSINDDRRHLKEVSSAPRLITRAPANDLQTPQQTLRRIKTSPADRPIAHLPFVLAFESDVIAEQLTIIEKDALDEVSWKDLVSLKWQQQPAQIHNWVDFLQQRRDHANGIDIVIARFNLAVKWVVSECVLTTNISERARCMTKYIHVAAHALRLRNYASMYQITLALLSSDLARLHRTWQLVPASDRAVLSRLEALCNPLRNFQRLRADMDALDDDQSSEFPDQGEVGCIPFIGLFTHDLVFNAQKPARIDAPVSMHAGAGGVLGARFGEPLVNFERFQTAAVIVKNLLRLVEASSNYVFRPHPEVLSRCLWLAALEDGEISARSRALEA